MVLREHNDPLNQSRGIMGPLENSAGVQNNRGRLRQRFDLIRKLGQGTYGKVQLGIDKETGQEVAIKTIKKSKIETDADLIRIRREIQIMSSVRHPNIIHIYEVFENREKMVLVMEYAAGGELYDYLNERKILQEDEARRIFRQVASAVYYCHKHKICHRDLKLENILLDEKSNAKIADFGLSNVFDDKHLLKTFCGSPLYASPEIVRGTPYYGPEVDCWSLGVLLYTLVYGAMPFDGSNFKRLVKQISNGDYYEPKQTAQASALIRHMLTVDPVKRATIRDVCDSQWLNQGFEEKCLEIAETLANQTPVRLDLLLSLAPASAINHDNMIIEKTAEPSPSHSKPKTSKLEPDVVKKKTTKDGKGKNALDTPSKTPAEVKRKQVVKKKSQSSPLLELIVDVEEEENEAEVDEDDAGDTLSEISEIHTIAEDNGEIKGKASKAKIEPLPKDVEKEKVPVVKPPAKVEPAVPAPAAAVIKPKPKAETPKEQLEKAVEKVERKSPAKISEPELQPPPPKTVKEPSPAKVEPPKLPKVEPAKPAKVEPPKPAKPEPIKPVKVEPPKPEPKPEEPIKPSPPPVEPVPEKPKETSTEPVKKPVLKKKVVKPKATDTVKDTESSSDTSKVEPKPAGSPQVKQQRSDSLTNENTSPTRIERRSSKIISQKTAELIQNLETKSSTDGPKGKKLVFPSLKVSDAKSRFENADSTSNGASKPGPLKSQLSIEKKTPVKSKSPSPKPAPAAVVKAETTPLPPKDNEVTEAKAEIKPKQIHKPEETPVPTKTPEKKEKEPTKAPEIKPKVAEPVVQPKSPTKVVPELKPVTPEPKAVTPEPKAVASVTVPKREEGPKPFPKSVGELQPAPPPKPAPAPKQLPKLKMPEQQELRPTLVTANAIDTSTPLTTLESGTTTGLSTTDPFFTDTESMTPMTPAKAKVPFSKLPPQNKEQAAKKIGSVIHRIVSSESVPKLNRQDSAESGKTMRSEVSFPVAAAQSKERVIPIKLIDENVKENPSSSKNSSGANVNLQRLPSRIDSMRSNSSVYSRQNSSDTESSVATAPPLKNDPIKKSPREFIIPIKMETSGHTVMPKEEVLNSETSTAEDNFRLDGRLRSGRFGKQRRYSSLLSDSSFEDEPLSASVSASTSRRSSATGAGTSSHARSLSQGDEPTASTSGTFKRGRVTSVSSQLDRSDSFSSAEEDEEDAFEVLTAESLFSSLLDRVRNLTKRLNKEDSAGPSWPNSGPDSPSFGLWNSGPLREFMASSAPLEAKQFLSYGPGTHTVTRSYSREPSVTVTITTGPGWRRSLSRDVSGDSSDMSEPKASGSGTGSHNLRHRPSLGNSSDGYETTSVRSLPTNLSSVNRRPSPFNYSSQKSEPGTSVYGTSSIRPAYGRTISNADYSTSVTLPLPFQRRSLRTYDRTLTGGVGESSLSHDRDPVHSFRGLTPRLSSDPSRFEPSRFEPGSPYLARLQSLNRASTPDPDGRRFGPGRSSLDSSTSPTSFLGSRVSLAAPTNSGESNGWVGGRTSPGTEAATAPLTTQEKMNNYQNYYRSLSETPAPLRRFCSINNPAAVQTQAPNYMIARPTTMYETSFVNLDNGDSPHYSMDDSPAAPAHVNNPGGSLYAPPSINTPGPRPKTPVNYSTKSLGRNISQNCSSSPGFTPSSSEIEHAHTADAIKNAGIPKWPSASITVTQHRPVSISSFPQQNNCGPEPFSPNPKPVPRVVTRVSSPPIRESSVEPQRRPLSPPPPPEKGRFVRAQTERLTSPPPESPPSTNPKPGAQPSSKFKRDARATSVEKITRLLERKSVPKEIPQVEPIFVKQKSPEPQELKLSPVDTGFNSLDKSVKTNGSGTKLVKPKFIQSLEKKWGKLTNKTEDSNQSTSAGSSPVLGNSPGPEESPLVPANESELLQRAVSPEKKPKTKFGASTVNFMLGKFRKIEESSSGPNVAKVPFGKPPIGSSKVGRRVQSVYAGAASDSVVSLAAPPEHRNYSEVKQKFEAELDADSRSGSNVTLCETQQIPPAPSPIVLPAPAEITIIPETKKPRRPLSLGIFSKNNESSKSASFIPRFNTSTTTNGKPSNSAEVEAQPPPPPQVTVDSDEPLTPTSDSSVSSEKTEVSVKSSALDDLEESVSDRIFRKSFYSRFNSLDRKKYGSSGGGTTTTTGSSGIRTYSPIRSLTATLPSSKALDGKNGSSTSLSPKINKYNPNPLFRELITDEFKSNTGNRTEYARRATSKLSNLLREIESDMKVPTPNGESTRNAKSPSPAAAVVNGNCAKSVYANPNDLTEDK